MHNLTIMEIMSNMNYTIKQITDISFSGFSYTISEDTIKLINELTNSIGSNNIITSNVFHREESNMNLENSGMSGFNSSIKNNGRKRKNKAMEISNEEWETLRTFQTTTIEQKIGIDADIDQIRLYLNKLTDKTFLTMREKIFLQIEKICSNNPTSQDKNKIATIIYELSAYNKFYSKIFADLYSELAIKYEWIKEVFDDKYATILDLYKNIEYVDADVNYDRFCEINKVNETRKSVTLFLVNFSNNKFIDKKEIMGILTQLVGIVYSMIFMNDKKNEVDELTENVAILFNKELIESYKGEEYMVSGKTIIELVNEFAKSKSKDFPSLSNKSIFKYMDLVEI